MVKARVRVSGVEHQTIIVARAGWSTAEPAPSSVAASTAVTAVEANPRQSAPTAPRTEAATTTGSGPRRSITRPTTGRTTSAAIANAARTNPAVPAPSPRTCAT
jgi:hypothetical protein